MHILPSGLPPSLVFRNGRLFDHECAPKSDSYFVMDEAVQRLQTITPREAPE